jgi:glutamate synthase domain-containing protein 3
VQSDGDCRQLRELIESHVRHTGSERGQWVLDHWEACVPNFVKVMPIEYRKALERMSLREDAQMETVSATEEVYR